MKIPTAMQFDFEVGTLAVSPCRRCHWKRNLPKCARECALLAKVQATLAGGVACANGISHLETFSLGTVDAG
jgi:hypothetical protein